MLPPPLANTSILCSKSLIDSSAVAARGGAIRFNPLGIAGYPCVSSE